MATDGGETTAQGVGSSVLDVTSEWSTGNEIQTGNWSDLMIQGNGFFEVQNSSGADYYTRDGEFTINSAGYLTDMQGDEVLDTNSKPISLAESSGTSGGAPTLYSSYSIDQYGNITATESNGTTVTLTQQIGITTFSNPDGLLRNGQNTYLQEPAAGTATTGTAGTGQAGTLISGALEGSNVDLTQQMVDLITYQAAYQANSKSIETGDENLQTVVNLIK